MSLKKKVGDKNVEIMFEARYIIDSANFLV